MSEKIIVEVFGIKDQAINDNSSGCSCQGGCCGPTKTMGQTYEEFKFLLSRSKIRQRIDVRFIDILREDMDSYGYAMEAMDKGYNLPLTAINGQIKFYGGLSNRMIYNTLRRMA
jgi:hypothetical protein